MTVRGVGGSLNAVSVPISSSGGTVTRTTSLLSTTPGAMGVGGDRVGVGRGGIESSSPLS